MRCLPSGGSSSLKASTCKQPIPINNSLLMTTSRRLPTVNSCDVMGVREKLLWHCDTIEPCLQCSATSSALFQQRRLRHSLNVYVEVRPSKGILALSGLLGGMLIGGM